MFGRAFPLSTRTNFVQSSTDAPTRRGAIWTTVLAALLSGACTLAYDSDRKQCAETSDCVARGFAGTTCVENVCQASTVGMDAGAGDTGLAPSGDTGPGNWSPDASPIHMDATAGAVEAGSGGEGDARAAETGAVCQGAGCPECSTNADCERRGIAGGVCADAKCWAQPPMPECDSDDDCNARGPEYVGGRCLASECRPNPRWRCEPPPPAPTSGTKQLKVLLRHSLTLDPLKNIQASICQKLDLECASPSGNATTGDDGYMHFSVPANFSGYLKVEAQGFFPAMYFMPAALPVEGELQPFPLLPSGLIADALALALGTGLDPTRGHMMLVAEDCMGNALPGVSFSSPQRDMMTVQFYVSDLLPSPEVTETGEAGNAGYLNFPAGTAVLNLKLVKNALMLKSVSVTVRPGFISVAYIRPELR